MRCTICGKPAEKFENSWSCCGRSWIVLPKPNITATLNGSECACGKPSAYEDGSCATCRQKRIDVFVCRDQLVQDEDEEDAK